MIGRAKCLTPPTSRLPPLLCTRSFSFLSSSPCSLLLSPVSSLCRSLLLCTSRERLSTRKPRCMLFFIDSRPRELWISAVASPCCFNSHPLATSRWPFSLRSYTSLSLRLLLDAQQVNDPARSAPCRHLPLHNLCFTPWTRWRPPHPLSHPH